MRLSAVIVVILSNVIACGFSIAAVPVVDGLSMHLKADGIAGKTDGDRIDIWPDSSGNGNDATQPSASTRPTYISQGLNGRAVLRFDGVDDMMVFPEIADIRTVFFVLKEDAGATENWRPMISHSTSERWHRGENKNFWSVRWGMPEVYNGQTTVNGDPVDGTSTKIPTEFAVISHTTTANAPANQIGRDRGFTNRVWDGDIAEILVYNRPLTSEEHNSVGFYLADKYAISSSYINPVPQVTNPSPAQGAGHVRPDATLSWETLFVSGPVFDVYIGTSPGEWDFEFAGVTETTIQVNLALATVYYWKVDIREDGRTWPGSVWSFTTGGKASDPSPADGSTGISFGAVDLSWTGDEFITHYRVFAGTSPPLALVGEVTTPGYGNLHVADELTTYYWRVDTYDGETKIAEGDTWSFTTRDKPRPCVAGDINGDCRVNFSDLLLMTDNWLDEATSVGDFTGDSRVNMDDLAFISQHWGSEGSLSVVISEFVATNRSEAPLAAGELLDEDGESSDWIEIHNMLDAEVNLDGWYLTDSRNDLAGWKFPEVTIEPGGYMVVFASGKNRRDPAGELHTDFQLRAGGEYLALVKPEEDGTETVVYDYDEYPQQYPYLSFGLSSSFTGSTSEITLIGEHVPASAYIPVDDSLGLTWTEIDFDDSGWLTGLTAVGYDLNPDYRPYIGLDVLDMRNVNETVYVRIPFQVDDVSKIDKLILKMRYEDAFVAYLNGANVVAQDNNPDPDQLTWNSGASGNRSDTVAVVQQEFDLTVHRNLLRNGANVLAIHGLNWLKTSSDLLILPELVAVQIETVDIAGLTRGYLATPTPGAANEAALASPGPAIIDMTDNPPRPADNEDIVITARIEETIGPVAGVTLHYRIMYDAETSVSMLDDGAGDDASPGDGIYTATIPADASGPGQMVRWYITASDAQGRTSRNPLFPNPDDSPEYCGTVVEDPSTESLLPVMEWFTDDPAGTESGGARASVYYDGLFYDNIRIHNRGGSTSRVTTTSGMIKAHFKFNFNPGHKFRYHRDFPRVDEFNLNHTYSDKAYLRQPLAFEFYDRCGCPGSYSFAVRAHRNGQFFAVMAFIEEPEEEMLQREGLDPRGALYKMYNQFTSPTGEKKTRTWEGTQDLADFMNGMNQTGTARHNYIFDAVDIPRMISYLVGTVITHQNDHPHKNHYLYRDSEGTGEWFFMPWDHDLTWGSNWTGSSYHDYIYAADDQVPGKPANVKPSHPFIGKADCQEWNYHWNRLTDKLLNDMTFRRMYLRRLRTVMDELLKAPGTPYAELVIENRIDEMVAQMQASVAEDYQRWVSPGWNWGGQGGYPRNQSFADAINIIKNDYLAVRRTHLFITHNVDRADVYPIANSYSARIPNAQPDDAVVLIDSHVEYTPATFNQDEEYIRLNNPNDYAVDISGWKLTDAVEHTFLAGTVIPANGSIYVSPHVATFRARQTGPGGNQGLFVQGDYRGHLSSWGETINLVDKTGRLVHTLTYQGDPGDAQRYLRITEMMYHPPDGAYGDPEELEYIELKNTGPQPLSLDGISFTRGISYTFGSGVTLPAQGYLLLVKNPDVFADAYRNVPPEVPVLGPYTGQLSNGGEDIKLEDARNETIHEFDYSDKWYEITDGAGFSLTIVDALAGLNMWDRKEGWRPGAAVGGSPGRDDAGDVPAPPGAVIINEVLAHSDLLPLDWIELHNTTDSDIYIGEWFISDSELNFKKFRIPAGTWLAANGFVVFTADQFNNAASPGCLEPFALSENGEKLYLHSGLGDLITGYAEERSFGASDPDVSMGLYTVPSTGEDHFVAMARITRGAPNSGPRVGPIVISEIMYHPAVEGDAEYIELLNVAAGPVTLFDYVRNEPWHVEGINDLKILDDGRPVTMNPTDRILLVRDLAVFATEFTADPSVRLVLEWPDGSLQNGGENIELVKPGDYDSDGVLQYIVVDAVDYSDGDHPENDRPDLWPTEPDGGTDTNADGVPDKSIALQRSPESAYGDDPANWTAADPTPGG